MAEPTKATIEAVFGGGGTGITTVTIAAIDEELKEPGRIPYPPVETSSGYIWAAPMISNLSYDWYIEESRIRGGYNNTMTDLGVKAHIVEDNPNSQNRFNTFTSRSSNI